jgi:hypothetical protein
MHSDTPHSRLRPLVDGWNLFWFTPGDPTVLGAIRILTGAVVFYTLLLYTLDLQELMGPKGWVDLPLRQEQYRNSPVVGIYPTWEQFGTPPEPTTEAEKMYVARYIAKWGMAPPGPFPQSREEEAAIDQYRARWGADPRMAVGKGQPVWSIWFHVTDPFWMYAVQAAIVLSSALFLLGYATRLTSALTWFAAVSFMNRNPAALFGVDTMTVVLLMYLTIGPSGAALSLDRWLALRRARRLGLPEPPLAPMVSATLALRLIQLHACIIYLSAGLSKLQGTSWWNGTAPWGTLTNHEYAPMHISLFVDFLHFLARYRWLYELSMTTATLGTLVFEIGYPFVIWVRGLRTVWLWMAVLLHLGIGMFLGLRTFSLLMLAFNLAFVSPATVRWALDRVRAKLKRKPAAAPVVAEQVASAAPAARPEKAPEPVAAAHGKRKRP